MKICMPVEHNKGVRSEIARNFRAAPALLLIDSDSRECTAIDASSGACHALPVHIDAVVCAGGIGRGMFNGLHSRGIRVFNTASTTVEEALVELAAGRLAELAEVECCKSGPHDHAAAHGHECGCGNPAGETRKSGCGCSHH